ncbi:MAG TPA: Wadjet anti-phage system protein JetD domain-containing protein [Streptosporangiaceae bacterium]|jgi:hypothetical protein|nr:Wadjet anti-phage system protein JetD domain-containing protein [Streptosporangiaceae bacterium]
MSPAAARRPAWVTPADVLRTLRKRWEIGTFLTQFASGQPWEPLGLPIRGPAAAELAASFADAQAWARGWAGAGRGLVRIEHKQVGGRVIGVNAIPCRAWIDSYERLWQLLDVEAEVARFGAVLDQAKAMMPALADWMIAHPVKVLALAHDWDRVLGTVQWIDQFAGPGLYLRQIDVPGVDTKFIERHRGILTDLLDCQLPSVRIDPTVPRSDFAGRYRFRKKPAYVRFRYLAAGPTQLSELTVRAAEMPTAPPGISAVYVVENEVTYLAFPPVADAIVIFGGGYAVSVLEQLPWLADRHLVYWGDIDTHGLEILARLRRRFPHTRSMLMDRATLLAHRSQWVTEPTPARPDPTHLTPDEAALAHDLTTDLYAPSLRLEQERIRFSLLQTTLAQLTPH